MKTILIVTGHLAALKSTISKQLSQDLGFICLNKDDIKEVLGDTIGFETREQNLKLSTATFELMLHMTQKILAYQDKLILESNFRPHEFTKLKALFQASGVNIVTLFLTGAPDVLYERYVLRHEHRHPVHQSTGFLSFEIFKQVMAPFDAKLYEPNVILCDTTTMDALNYQTLKEKITVLVK